MPIHARLLIQATKDINKYIISRNDEWNAYSMPSQENKKIIIRNIQENTQNILCKITRWSQPLLKYHWRMDKYHQLKILEAKCHSLSCNGHYIGNNEYKPSEHLPTITSVHLPPLPAPPPPYSKNTVTLIKPIWMYYSFRPTYVSLTLMNTLGIWNACHPGGFGQGVGLRGGVHKLDII